MKPDISEDFEYCSLLTCEVRRCSWV